MKILSINARSIGASVKKRYLKETIRKEGMKFVRIRLKVK